MNEILSSKPLAYTLSEEKDPHENQLGEDDNRHEKRVSSDDDASVRIPAKKRFKRFSDSESKENTDKIRKSQPINNLSSDSDDYMDLLKQTSVRTSIRDILSEDSDCENAKIRERQLDRKNGLNRFTERRKKLKEKFQNLLDSKDKDETYIKHTSREKEIIGKNGSTSPIDEEITSISEIKKKIKLHSENLKISICDPDTSEDESNYPKPIEKLKKKQKRIKLTSPKPQRMSAKQASENMQKIKSESNRMLREKDVSLPYHRPKALSLKDIMSRRKPAVSSDGKVLPIKMNEEQLRQYALQLEQRQKEMIELCRSDTEEEGNDTADDNQQVDDMSIEFSHKTTKLDDENCHTDTFAESNASVSSLSNEISSVPRNFDGSELIKETSNIIKTPDKAIEFNNTIISDLNTDIENVQDKSEDVSAEMELVYNDSAEENSETNFILEDQIINTNKTTINTEQNETEQVKSMSLVQASTILTNDTNSLELEKHDNNIALENLTEKDSQLISLQYDTDKNYSDAVGAEKIDVSLDKNKTSDNNGLDRGEVEINEFPDDDNELENINMGDIDTIIENALIIKDSISDNKVNSPVLVNQSIPLSLKPKLTGAPGMVIDLDGCDAVLPKKITGVELLKERFIFFSKLKTPEEIEREREKRQKPGTQHIKLKQELEEKIAEQRSLEWTKRLEREKQQKEIDIIKGDLSDLEDDIDKIEAKLEENKSIGSCQESEEEEIEDDVLIEDRPRKKNPLVADEAEESDADETVDGNAGDAEIETDNEENNADDDDEENGDSQGDSSDDEVSSESSDEKESKPKKGRILKAFEDSDDEDPNPFKDKNLEKKEIKITEKNVSAIITSPINETVVRSFDVAATTDIEKVIDNSITTLCKGDNISESQDDDLQLAQVPKNHSEELFTSQESIPDKPPINKNTNSISTPIDIDLGSQTFSILSSTTKYKNDLEIKLGTQEKMSVLSETQPFDDNLDAVVGMCSGSFSQNFIEFKPPSTQSQSMDSQAIGEDILDMCTGKFYDSKFVSQTEDNSIADTSIEVTQEYTSDMVKVDEEKNVAEKGDRDILKSVLDELHETELETPKPMKYFFDSGSQNKENKHDNCNTQFKKKFVIDSDDEMNVDSEGNDKKKKIKIKLQKRALQISDDEDGNQSTEEEYDDLASENNDMSNADEERLVEYDSEENEIEVKQPPKKKRKATDFFEQEAELSSEDEWAGSGDEDEAGLDCMEREAGDDDTFHQGRLQAELGQIHMRDVLDQDKREVRLIHELLFEDGDLGGGGRQRKFRWRNADGEDVSGTAPDELADTQEEEFESEEQWRKQRHEREMFLRQLKSESGVQEDLNVSVNRTTIIKANLLSRTMSSVLEDANKKPDVETTQSPAVAEKATVDIPSPKKPFQVFKQNYHGSLLTRGRGALARLAAIATPLVADDDAPKMGLIAASSKRNFVFAAITPEEKEEPKVTKRKAETNVGTPRLVKKMRTEDKKQPKTSLLDHLKA